MEDFSMDWLSLITTLATMITGGGWFIYYRANKRKANGEAMQTEAEANKLAQEYYNKTLEDANNTIQEVRSERDHYKEDRNALRKENEEMFQKYSELQEKVNNMELEYKKDIARLGRRIDILSPFLCGVVDCMKRRRVDIVSEKESEKKEESNGND